MAKEKELTLIGLLESWDIDCGDDRSFMLTVGHTDMVVSRRYIECDAWRHLLSRKVLNYGLDNTIYGQMIHIDLQGDP